MANRRLTWDLPTVTPRQAAIAGVRIEFRVDPSFDWTVQDTVAPDVTQELLFVDVAPGTFFYRAIVVDVEGTEGAPVEIEVFGSFDVPGEVTNFVATDE